MSNIDTQWKKGQSGNPNGRPSEFVKWRHGYLSRMMHKYHEGWDDLLKILWDEALSGNLQAIRLICEYVLPKPVAVVLTEDSPTISLSHLKTDADRAKARRIAEKAKEEIQKLGDGTFNDR